MKKAIVGVVLVLAGMLGSVVAATPADARQHIDICDYFRNTLICGEGPLGP